ncbi:VOC family protein [Actinokineospora auranticolor]|uniref:Putative glyoxalase superfamily protein PhnB n=1 Tax=Actinokineospora auranticolor TaxID=155976 RepID=A0A2S6H1S7_9PSEU|nr:VOC family protein [Actinokineospora auranticolor]PPK71439.1 putative glyoxalase superfamily protein PhnB [Actinokineospora auranticolor]
MTSFTRPATITPYLAVADAPRAIDWYVRVFDGHRRGEPYLMPDGRIGHAEIGIGDAVLMLAEGGVGEVPVVAPDNPTTFTHSLNIQVEDVDATFARAVAEGAAVERHPEDQDYGRVAVLVDPFGHRWLVTGTPVRSSRTPVGESDYLTMVVRDADRAKGFYGAVLGWEFVPGSVEGAWQVANHSNIGLWANGDEPANQLCFRVADIEAALRAVTTHGGKAGEAKERPFGLLADCADPEGTVFYLYQT